MALGTYIKISRSLLPSHLLASSCPYFFVSFPLPGLPPQAQDRGAAAVKWTGGTEPAVEVWGLRSGQRFPLSSIPQLTGRRSPKKVRREKSLDAKNESKAARTCHGLGALEY